MSFSRTHYDKCSYVERLNENVSALDYTLDTVKYNNCRQCIHSLGLVSGNSVSRVAGNLVDLESNLMGIDRPTSRCAKYRYMPTDGYVQGKRQYKTIKYPKVNTAKRHLPRCQMFGYPEVPAPPQPSPFSC